MRQLQLCPINNITLLNTQPYRAPQTKNIIKAKGENNIMLNYPTGKPNMLQGYKYRRVIIQ